MTVDVIKAALGITDASKDVLIDLHLESLKAEADKRLNNPFHERDWDEDSDTYGCYIEPRVELPIPKDLEEAIFTRVAVEVARLTPKGRPGKKPVQSKSAGGWSKTLAPLTKPYQEAQAKWEKVIKRYRLSAGA